MRRFLLFSALIAAKLCVSEASQQVDSLWERDNFVVIFFDDDGKIDSEYPPDHLRLDGYASNDSDDNTCDQALTTNKIREPGTFMRLWNDDEGNFKYLEYGGTAVDSLFLYLHDIYVPDSYDDLVRFGINITEDEYVPRAVMFSYKLLKDALKEKGASDKLLDMLEETVQTGTQTWEALLCRFFDEDETIDEEVQSQVASLSGLLDGTDEDSES